MTLVEKGEFESVLVSLRRVTRVMKGGKRFRFSALIVVGDGNGRVGVALAKAPEAMLAIRKAEEKAKKHIFKVPIVNGTIPHEVLGINTTSKVLLKPAGQGTGIISSMPVRSVLEKAGYKNVLTKSLGSNNHINLVWATVDALLKLKTKEQQLEILASQEIGDQFEKYLKKTFETKKSNEDKIANNEETENTKSMKNLRQENTQRKQPDNRNFQDQRKNYNKGKFQRNYNKQDKNSTK